VLEMAAGIAEMVAVETADLGCLRSLFYIQNCSAVGVDDSLDSRLRFHATETVMKMTLGVLDKYCYNQGLEGSGFEEVDKEQ